MNIKIIDSKTKNELSLTGDQFVLDENNSYVVHHNSGGFTESDFKLIGTYISPNLGILQSINKIGVFRLKETTIRFKSKLGDDFFEKIKTEIAEIEKLLLLSSNALEDQFGLTYGVYLEEVALALFFEAWEKGNITSALRAIFENPNYGFLNKRISKNLSHGAVLSALDFQYLNKEYIQLGQKNGKVLPLVFSTVFRNKTHDILEMRFIKFFLFYCYNLLERNILSQLRNINELERTMHLLKTDGEDRNSIKIKETYEVIKKAKDKHKRDCQIKLSLNRYLKSEILKNVAVNGDVDFTSLKLHNNFHYKSLLELFLKMRKSFDVISNSNLVHLDINSLENLYEYYCFIKIIKSFEIKPEALKKIIYKNNIGWVIDKSKSIDLGLYKDVKLSLYFKKKYLGIADTYSQDYEPDYSIALASNADNVEYMHLDAKYKHNNYNVKKEDIDKMHTYTHAIKSTKSSIVLFPGKNEVFYSCGNSVVGAIPCTPWATINLKDIILDKLGVMKVGN